jgi:pSer/pThr/pTyr-binding forkhead associated (FHA) protein
MKVKLKVLKGSNAGKEVRIPTPECLIGRGPDCHLRPKSEAISRRHAMIFAQEGKILIRDLGSRNGTYVNGDKIAEERVLQSGDRLQFGPLAFEILIDHTLGGEKKPKVESVKEAAVRATTAPSDSSQVGDLDVSDWLEEADVEARARRMGDPETRQLKLDETDQVTLQKAIEERAKRKVEEQKDAQDDTKELTPPEKGKGKKTPGKLPQRPEAAPKSSREAATEMLKKFFNKR